LDLGIYLKDLTHDINTYLLDGLKDFFSVLWSTPTFRNIIISATISGIVLYIIYSLLRSQGFSKRRASGITNLIDFFSNLFNK
jgi:uncharacterized membrane protein